MISPPTSTAPVFPDLDDHKRLRQSLRAAEFNRDQIHDHELWRLYAYDYGWRRVVREDFSTVSPIDPTGSWFNPEMALAAEKMWRTAYRKPMRENFAPPTEQNPIRDNCRKIPWNELTNEEQEFLAPEIDAMLARSRNFIKSAEAKWKSAFKVPPSTRFVAPAKEHDWSSAKITPERLDELLKKLPA